MIQIIKYRYYFLTFSTALVLCSAVVLVAYGLNLGIDFRGGSLLEAKFSQPIEASSLSAEMSSAGYSGVVVQATGDRQFLIKSESINSEEERQALHLRLKETFGDFEEMRFDSIGPIVGQELRQKALWQISLVVLGILLYIAYAFRKIGSQRGSNKISSWKLSWAAIIALAHDLIITLGIFAVLGKFLHVEIDSLFITALLTILGFSIHDTIVVFDRVRENLTREQGLSFAEVLNLSFNQTLARSINTSTTVLLVLLAMALFGGATTFYFVVALLIGIAVGTYSSIFVASPLLLLWNKD